MCDGKGIHLSNNGLAMSGARAGSGWYSRGAQVFAEQRSRHERILVGIQ